MLDWRYIMPRLTECARARVSERARIIVNVYHSRTKIRTRDVTSYSLLCNLVCVCGRRWGVEGGKGGGGSVNVRVRKQTSVFLCLFVKGSVCVCVRPAVSEHARGRPAALGSLVPFLILCILNQDHTSHLSDDKRSFGHFCQQAQLQR